VSEEDKEREEEKFYDLTSGGEEKKFNSELIRI
jgi:hypothetical protein